MEVTNESIEVSVDPGKVAREQAENVDDELESCRPAEKYRKQRRVSRRTDLKKDASIQTDVVEKCRKYTLQAKESNTFDPR